MVDHHREGFVPVPGEGRIISCSNMDGKINNEIYKNKCRKMTALTFSPTNRYNIINI